MNSILTTEQMNLGLRYLDEVKHCEHEMGPQMAASDRKMRDTSPMYWTLEDIKGAKERADWVCRGVKPGTKNKTPFASAAKEIAENWTTIDRDEEAITHIMMRHLGPMVVEAKHAMDAVQNMQKMFSESNLN